MKLQNEFATEKLVSPMSEVQSPKQTTVRFLPALHFLNFKLWTFFPRIDLSAYGG
jgi:hypothetical protein